MRTVCKTFVSEKMQTTILLFNLAAVFVLFHTGHGSKLCTWSQRLIPKNATGDITLEVPIAYSYRTGYIGSEQFWTYIWAKGWCSYNDGYFRCPYTKHGDYDATSITLPNVEKISYVMLESEYPITIHKLEDESFPGFHVKEGTALDICTDRKNVLMKWFFNGEESDLQDISCYEDQQVVCSGLRPAGAPKDSKCGYTKKNGRMEFRYRLFHKGASKSFFYCYANKERTRALTYIVDWRGAPKTTPSPVTTEDKLQEIRRTGVASLLASSRTTSRPDTTMEIEDEKTNSASGRSTDVPDVMF